MTRGRSAVNALCSVDGQVSATVVVDDAAAVVHVHFDVRGGHTNSRARDDLVQAVLDLPEMTAYPDVAITVPLGDAELLGRLSAGFDDVHTRAAGASCLIDARTLAVGRARAV
jgi:hypothetical protein